ncbi:putative uncharacterized protein [Clostridium sp. CAG:230]|nr:putative uncharacterized protein [Clostridium sp. CAG:230]
MQSTDVELETDDLKEFVDMADVDDLDVSDGDDFFGDLGDISDLGEIPELSEIESTISDAKKKKEENTTVKQAEESVPVPDVADMDSNSGSEMMSDEDIQALLAANETASETEETSANVDREESVPMPDVADMESNSGSEMMSDEDIRALLAANENTQTDTTADDSSKEDVPDIAAIDDSSEESMPDITAIDDSSEESIPDIAALDDGSEESIPDIAAIDDSSEESIPDIAALDDSSEESIPDIAALDDSSEGNVPDIAALDDTDSSDGLSDNDMESALDALNDDQESSGSGDIDSMLDGLLDNLDMKGTLGDIDGNTEEMPEAEQMSQEDSEESLDSLADLLGMTGEPVSSEKEDDMQSLLDASLLPDEKNEENDEKKTGFFKKVFGNVITDEIAQEEREAAQKEAKEAEEKAEKDAADAEEKAKQKEEKKAAKEAKKAEKAKQKAEKKAAKEAKKAEKKAKEEEEEAAELEIVGKLNKVGVAIIVIATILFLTIEITGTNLWGYASAKQAADKYFKMGKYTEAYQEALGTKMRDKDPEMYQKIKTVMKVQQSINAYQNYERVGYYPDALNALLQGIRKYDDNLSTAIDLEADQDLKKCREQILSNLQSEFGVSESEAYSLLSLDQNSYTDKVVEIGRQKVK